MKFTIRDLLLVTAIAALVLGWAVDHYRSKRMAERVKRAEKISATLELVLRDNGWDVEFANGYVAGHKVRYPSNPATTFAVPISQALAPITPKKQAGPHPDP